MDVNTYEYLAQAFRAVAAERRKGGITPARLMALMQNMLDYIASSLNNQAMLIAGKADIVGGKVPMSQLPDGLDDMQEYVNRAAFPETGQDGVIYLAKDTNKTYRWSGTTYTEISSSLSLGETASTAYAGNKGKANADAIEVLQRMMDTLEEDMTGKADVAHTHAMSDITGLINTLAGKADASHTHQISDISGLEAAIQSLENMEVTGIGLVPATEGVGIRLIYGDGSFSESATMQPVSNSEAGVMTPSMYNKLLEVDDKAEEEHTHTMADITNLESIISTINNSLESTVNTSTANAEAINMLREQLQGKNVCKVFETRTDADGWMSDPISRRQLLVGSMIFIKNQTEQDYLILEVLDSPDTSGTNPTGFYYKVSDVQKNIPSLAGYAETAADNIFSGNNTFQGNVEFTGDNIYRGADQHLGEVTFINGEATNSATTNISSSGVSTNHGSRYVQLSGGIDEYGVGATKQTTDPFTRVTTTKTGKLTAEHLEFTEGEDVVTLTPADILHLASLWNKFGGNVGALNVTSLLMTYSQELTFDDLKAAVKMYMTDGTNYREVHVMNLVDATIPYGSLYYDDIDDDKVKRYMFSISEANGVISTSAPTIYILS